MNTTDGVMVKGLAPHDTHGWLRRLEWKEEDLVEREVKQADKNAEALSER